MAKQRQQELNLMEAAIEYWKAHRPLKWDQDQHLEHPTVNIASDKGADLAHAVADYLKAPFLAAKEQTTTQVDIVLGLSEKVAQAANKVVESEPLELSKNLQSLKDLVAAYNTEMKHLLK